MGYPSGSIDNIYVPLYFKPTGTYVTEVATATGLSQWGVFDADSTDNGQSLTYEIRTASTTGNLATTNWRANLIFPFFFLIKFKELCA